MKTDKDIIHFRVFVYFSFIEPEGAQNVQLYTSNEKNLHRTRKLQYHKNLSHPIEYIVQRTYGMNIDVMHEHREQEKDLFNNAPSTEL